MRIVHLFTSTRNPQWHGYGNAGVFVVFTIDNPSEIDRAIWAPEKFIWRDGGPLEPFSNPLCDIPSGYCFVTGPWTATRSSLRILRRVAAFCRPLLLVLLLVSFPRSRSPVVGVPGLCWMWHGVPFARQWRPVVGVLRLCWLLLGSFDCFCRPRASVQPPITCLPAFPHA